MEKIIWKELFNTHIDIVDFQHKILVERLNELIELHNIGYTQEQLLILIHHLEDYTHYHFETEEAYFKYFNYIELKEHIAEHNFFKEKLKIIKNEIKNSNKKIDEELLVFLSTWLLDHILGTDRIFADELNKAIQAKRD